MTDTLVPPPVDEIRRAHEAEAGPTVEQYRKRLRRRLLLWSAPVVLVVLLVALKLLSLPTFAALTQWSYGDQQFERSASLSEPLGVANVVEPWVHHFDRGTAYAQIGVLDVARQEFVTALDLAPDDATISCVIRVNLVLTIEAQGDAALLELRYADAEALYELGQKTVDEAPEGCFQPPDDPRQPDTSQPLDDAQQRLDEKGQQAQGGQGDEQQPGGDDGSDPGAGGDEPDEGEGQAESDDPLDQLQQQGEESQQQQQQDTDRDRYYEQNPGDYDGKPW
ncbi:hypothetical protein [Frigoribacterium sp. CFBP 8751]|uniref:hypothetical protein n=1 Tax=Frigoribacterium sp. CFBP 8751 TaxID=2775277 RepID=UPI0017839CC8|nr:hypothetical protein [Frigoribacterium sp. CFBP 8751]MBD8539046.1 hypothetical protein [Frigoribacterium sp. CFBP 8751]